MNKKLKNITSSFALLSSIMMAPLAQAQISPKMLKNITSYFNPNLIHFSPVIGMSALESGLISNYRFMTPDLAFTDNDTQNRSYRGDESHTYEIKGEKITDAISHLTTTLFRSPAGALAPQQGNQTVLKFTNIATPAKIGLILNYVHELRKLKDEEKNITTKKGQDRVEANKIPARIQELKINLRKQLKETNHSRAERDINDLTSAIEKAVVQEIEPNLEKQFLYPDHTTEQIILAYFCQKFDDQKDVVELLLSLNDEIITLGQKAKLKTDFKYIEAQGETISELGKQNLLKKEDLDEIVGKPTYKIDDIYALLHFSVFTGKTTPYGTDYIVNNSCARAYNRKTNQQLSVTFADCSETTLRHLTNLVLYDIDTEQFDLKYIKQHMASQTNNPYFEKFITFYDHQDSSKANRGDYHIRSLWNEVVGDLNIDSNSDIKIRYAKTDPFTNVEYELSSGIINSLNVFNKLFSLSLNPLTETNLENKKNWIEASLTSLLKTLNPNHSYVFDLSSLKDNETKDDMAGTFKIQVKNAQNQRLFSFEFYAKFYVLPAPASHQEIKYLESHGEKLIDQYEIHRYFSSLSAKSFDMTTIPIAQSIWLNVSNLEKSFQKIVDDKIQTPFYKLLKKKLEDNQSKINFLNCLKLYYEQQTVFSMSPLHISQLKHISANIFKTLSWDDHDTFNRIFPFLNNILQSFQLQNNFATEEIRKLIYDGDFSKLEKFTGLRYLKLKDSKIQEINNFHHFHQLKTIDLFENEKLEKLIFIQNIPNLETISVKDCAIKQITGWHYLPNLKSISLTGNKLLKEISFSQNMPNLEEIVVVDSEIEEITNWHYLSNLKKIYLSRNKSVKKIIFSQNMPDLTTISIDNCEVEEITGWHYLPNLKSIDLRGNKLLKKITFTQDMYNLDTIRLASSEIEEIIGLDYLKKLMVFDLYNNLKLKILDFKKEMTELKEINLRNSGTNELTGLHYLTGLDKINLDYNKYLKKFTIAQDMPNLKELSLGFTPIEEFVDIHHLTGLTKLNIDYTQNLKQLIIPQDMPNLEELRLGGSSIEELVGIHHLTGLKTLGLIGAKNLKTLTIVQDMPNLKELILTGSGVTRATLQGLEHIDESIIRW